MKMNCTGCLRCHKKPIVYNLRGAVKHSVHLCPDDKSVIPQKQIKVEPSIKLESPDEEDIVIKSDGEYFEPSVKFETTEYPEPIVSED